MAYNPPTVLFDEKKIDAIFAPFDQCRLPGAAVGIAIHGTPVYRRGFGVANMELPILLSTNIRMRIASISKHFTALAYMLLCEDGIADIDDPIGKYLPELHRSTHKVTMRQLMGNIGGLHDAYDICHQFSGTAYPATSAELLSFYGDLDEINAQPGTAWIYNNGGFLILSFAIERISGQSLEQVFQDRIFEPIGMYQSLLRRWETDFVPNSATAHMTSASGEYEKSNFFGNAWAGEGGIVSTVDDMLRWLAHMDAPTVGSAATWKAMKTSQVLANGTLTGYGLGLHIDRYRGAETLYHPGGGLGSSAQMIKVPSVGLDVVILVNREDVHATALADKVLDACLVGLDPAKEQSTGSFAFGTFRSPTTGRVIQLFTNEGHQTASIDGMDIPVERDSGGILWPAGFFRDVKQAITLVGDPVQPTSIRLSDFGNIDNLVRVDTEEAADVSVITGLYRSKVTGTEITVSKTVSGAQLLAVGRFGSVTYSLECLSQGIWRAKSMRSWYRGGILSFERDVRTFRFYSALCRMWGLRFSRNDSTAK
jgi:D-aminopeptidase